MPNDGKQDLGAAFELWLRQQKPKLPAPTTEFQFAPPRRWRFDYAWPAELVAVEIEGITFLGGRHQRRQGFVNDCEKYEAALLDGWRVYRVPGPWIAEGGRLIWREQVMTTLKTLLGESVSWRQEMPSKTKGPICLEH